MTYLTEGFCTQVTAAHVWFNTARCTLYIAQFYAVVGGRTGVTLGYFSLYHNKNKMHPARSHMQAQACTRGTTFYLAVCLTEFFITNTCLK